MASVSQVQALAPTTRRLSYNCHLAVLLRGGEDAFNEIKERDDFGKSKDTLD
jgi:hypothetical protein